MTEEKQTAVAEDQKPIDKMTVKELRELAKEADITGTSAMKKDELLAIIKEAKGIVDDAPKPAATATKKAPKKKDSTGPKVQLNSAKDCKALIITLREEKASAKESGDKQTVLKLRRRINVLKKKSRKLKKAV